MARTVDRGYGAEHKQERAQWKRRIDAGEIVPCSRCGGPISTGMKWHLDHDDHDRSIYRGPAHEYCNLRAAGRRAAASTNRKRELGLTRRRSDDDEWDQQFQRLCWSRDWLPND